MKGILRVKVDAPMLEERIELLLCRPILRIELVNVVIRHVKRLHIPFRLDNPDVPVSDGMVQQPVTDKVYQSAGDTPVRYSAKKCGCSLIKEMMLYDFCCCGLKQHFPCCVTMNLSLRMRAPRCPTGHTREAQAVAPVQVIARVDKHVLNVQPAQKIVISQFALSHGLPPHFISLISRFISASKQRMAISLGVSTPSLMYGRGGPPKHSP